MTKKVTLLIGGTIFAVAMASLFGMGVFEGVDVSQEEVVLTEAQYQVAKQEIVRLYDTKEGFTFEELQVFIAIADEEAKRGTFNNIKNFNISDSVPQMIEIMKLTIE